LYLGAQEASRATAAPAVYWPTYQDAPIGFALERAGQKV